MIAEVMDKQMVEKMEKNTTIINKNIIDISDDSMCYDKQYDNPMSFIKRVLARASSPNVLRGKQLFYGQFITQLFGPDGKIDGKDNMWDPTLAGMSMADGESLGKMKIFVCIVYIPELQFMPFPLKDDWKAIEQIALNGGTFKSFTYLYNGGAIPQYNDTVLVSFGDPSNRSEGWFEYPEVEGAGGGSGFSGPSGGAAGGPGGGSYRGGGPAFMCKAGRPKTPKPKQSKNTKTTKTGDTKKETKAVTGKPKKPSKEETNKQTPAKKNSCSAGLSSSLKTSTFLSYR